MLSYHVSAHLDGWDAPEILVHEVHFIGIDRNLFGVYFTWHLLTDTDAYILCGFHSPFNNSSAWYNIQVSSYVVVVWSSLAISSSVIKEYFKGW